mmetsp:Transcript_37790/g.91929  ORF Transcript_37790/g.91929 Transcript_37790/m.91929 type:complete len:112 (+) Transcript_37790:1102-1437(+)
MWYRRVVFAARRVVRGGQNLEVVSGVVPAFFVAAFFVVHAGNCRREENVDDSFVVVEAIDDDDRGEVNASTFRHTVEDESKNRQKTTNDRLLCRLSGGADDDLCIVPPSPL